VATLDELGVQLSDGALETVAARAAGATALPVPAVAGGDEPSEEDKAVLQVAVETAEARRGATKLAAALADRRPTGPYGDKDVIVALKGICPLWPFC
ncbi:MAG TPA: hypothetical protein VF228_16720, partial [Iamia sp.]